jgi:hypothetical protein
MAWETDSRRRQRLAAEQLVPYMLSDGDARALLNPRKWGSNLWPFTGRHAVQGPRVLFASLVSDGALRNRYVYGCESPAMRLPEDWQTTPRVFKAAQL